MSGPRPKFFGAGSKFPYVLYVCGSGPICFIEDDLRRRRRVSAKKFFVAVMFQCSVYLMFFCSFPNSFPKVSVVNMVHRQKKGSNV